MRRLNTLLFVVLVLVSCIVVDGRAQAQCLPAEGPPLELSDRAVISLITVYPGNQIHAFWGHTALRVRDPMLGIDHMYNYGAFRFDKYFVPKFVYGELNYILCISEMRRELYKYREYEKRTVVEQKLALNQEERQQVFAFIHDNAREENREYRYDFLYDNCSTRILDLIEDILGEKLQYAENPPVDKTFRQILQPYVEHFPVLSLGIDLGLALPVDKKPEARELMGLPMYMMEAYDEADVIIDGDVMPLVSRKDTLLLIDDAALREEGGNRTLLYLVVWGVLVVGLIVTNSRAKRLRIWFDRVLFGVTGLAGLLAVFLWFISLHHVTNYNWNLLWAWPTHFFVVFWLSNKKNRVVTYMRACAVTLVITVLGWYFWPQELNIALMPIVLTLLIRSAWWGWNPASRREELKAAAATG